MDAETYDDGAEYDSAVAYDDNQPNQRRPAMSKIKRDDKKLPVANTADRGDAISAACNPNPNITAAAPKVAAFKAANDELRTAHLAKKAADAESQRLTKDEKDANTAWDLAHEALCQGIEVDTNGNASAIRTTALVPYEPGKPTAGTAAAAVATAPTNAHASTGHFAGEIDLGCDHRDGAHGYIWQICAGDPSGAANWKALGQGSRTGYTATGLISGTKYWFRVAVSGSGTDTQSPWSDAAQGMAA